MSTTDDRQGPDSGRPTTNAGGPGPSTASPLADAATDSAVTGGNSTIGRLAATVERLRQEVKAAQAAADGRALIELAKGILVERLGCGPAQAARQLAVLADHASVTLVELAADIVNEASRDHVSEAAAQFLDQLGTPSATTGTTPSPAVQLRTAESGVLAADDTQSIAESLLENAVRPLGGSAVAVWSAGGDGSLTLAGHAGFTTEEAGRWRYVPPGVTTLARQALDAREPVTIPRLTEAGPPSIGGHHWSEGGRIAVPAGTGGRIHGVLEICWPHPLTTPTARIMRQIEALAELCAHTLGTQRADIGDGPVATACPDLVELIDLADGLGDPTLVLTPHLDGDGRLTDFRVRHINPQFTDLAGRPRTSIRGALLLEAYPLAAQEQGLFDRVERVFATGEPFRARRMELAALVDQVPLTAVADVSISRHGGAVLLIWRLEDEAVRLASLLQHAQRLGRIGGFEENIVTGEITWNSQLFDLHGQPPSAPPLSLQDLPAHAHQDDTPAIGRFLRAILQYRRPASVAFRLQRPNGITRHIRVIAEPVLDTEQRLSAVRGAYQDISSQHWTEVALTATRDRLAHSEAESEERTRLALQLQHAIMPPSQGPLDLRGLRIAVRYRPAASDALVGGDWYDTVVLPSQQILLCVGDVAGHGIEAATSMVVLRNALRGLAVTGAGPGQLLTWLNLVSHHLSEQVTATAVCGLYDPRTHVLRWARAGHLPPVLIREENAQVFPLGGGLLLGAAADVSYLEREIKLEPGDILLMYSDGLVERRGLAVSESISQLLAAAGGPGQSLEERLDRLLAQSSSDTDDDTCLIGIEVT